MSVSRETTQIARQTYIYGFPRLLMQRTYEEATGQLVGHDCHQDSNGQADADTFDVNTFNHLETLATPASRQVVRPNVDTLYSIAFLELSQGPVRLEMPAELDRYNLMAMYDAWSNNFAGPRSHQLPAGSETGHETLKVLVVGPKWRGTTAAEDVTLIEAPTNLVWIIGRTELRGGDDLENVKAIQQRYILSPEKEAAQCNTSQPTTAVEYNISAENPEDYVKALRPLSYFDMLSRLMIEEDIPEADAAAVSRSAEIGVGPQATISVHNLDTQDKLSLALGMKEGQALIDLVLSDKFGQTDSIWLPDPADSTPIGEYGTDYLARAVISQTGFGANKKEYSIYMTATKAVSDDGSGGQEPLTGDNGAVYRMTFDAVDGRPDVPVDGFWSVTVYDREGFLTENELGRYALGSYSPFHADAGGRITIYFSHTLPAGVPTSNWLPVPEGLWETTFRLYTPHAQITDPTNNNRWRAPDIIRVL